MIKNYNQFNESLNFPNTEEEIHKLCKEYDITNYTINEDMSIDVNDNVHLNHKSLYRLPLKFNRIYGSFYCSSNKLESLTGFPIEVKNNFNCSYNKLTSLEGMPCFVGESILCQVNKIKSFKGISEDIGEGFYCIGNPINEIYKLFNSNSKAIYWLNEYDVIRGDNVVIERLEEVFIQLSMDMPIINEIKGYNLI